MGKTFILSDESVNSFGFWVQTEGIDLSAFQKNPVMLWNHTRGFFNETDNQVLPIGHWENVRIEGDQLKADAVFDENDPFAQKIARKVEKEHVKAASIGIEPVEISEADEHLKKGQTRATVTRSVMLEASVVDIPSNQNSLALYNKKGEVINLHRGGEIPVPLINREPKPNHKDMKEIRNVLKLAEGASEQEAVKAIETLRQKAEKAENLQKELDSYKQKTIETLVDQAIGERKLTREKREHFIKLGKDTGADTLKNTLSAMQPAGKPGDFISGKSGGKNPAAYEKLSQVPENEVTELRENDRETYRKLYKAEYEIEPEFE